MHVSMELVEQLRSADGPDPALARLADGTVGVVPDAGPVIDRVMITKRVLFPLADEMEPDEVLRMLDDVAESGTRIDWLHKLGDDARWNPET